MRVGLLKQNYDKNTKINALKTDIPPPSIKKKPQKHNNPKFYRIKKSVGTVYISFF